MDPVTATLALKVGSAAAGAFSGMASSKAQQEQARVNSFIGETRAIQTDTSARQGLNSELGSLRAALGANGQAPSVGTFEMAKSLRETRDRDRRIQVGARMSEAADWRMAGKNARAQGRASLLTGMLKAGPSLFDMYQYKSGG